MPDEQASEKMEIGPGVEEEEEDTVDVDRPVEEYFWIGIKIEAGFARMPTTLISWSTKMMRPAPVKLVVFSRDSQYPSLFQEGDPREK